MARIRDFKESWTQSSAFFFSLKPSKYVNYGGIIIYKIALLIVYLLSTFDEALSFENRPSPSILKFNECRDENLKAFQNLVQSKIGDGVSCKTEVDCVYIVYGEGYAVTRATADQQFDCISDAHQAYFNYCLKKYPGKSYPVTELKFFDDKARPTRLLCEQSRCVARFDPPKSKVPNYKRGAGVRAKSCKKELEAIFPK